VVEVGSGRGGGCSYIARTLGPSNMTGVDCSEKAVSFCKGIHNHPALVFKQGDCEALPFEDGAVDAVVNVESSHCYPSMPGFLREVMRVLKPGGHLLWADIRSKETCSEMYRTFETAGFVVLRDSIITENVVAALDEVTERKQEIIDEKVPKLFRSIASDFAGLKGTKVYDRFLSGEMSYYSFTLQKPEA
jgi:ubiquinone/menaquinone biosynthesis C-methylase UbiE